MSSTLEALNRAVIETPADRTVRLVYADALDETGGAADAARAAFIRAQIEAENTPREERRFVELVIQANELFEEYWLAWWRPVARDAGLPEPHVPGRRVRDRLVRALRRRRRRPRNWPYSHITSETTVHLAEYGVSFRFAGGFPEEVWFEHFATPEDGPELLHNWGDAIPLTRLVFSSNLTAVEWERVNGPHLARLVDLTFERLSAEVAAAVRAAKLTKLTRLSANPAGASGEAIRARSLRRRGKGCAG